MQTVKRVGYLTMPFDETNQFHDEYKNLRSAFEVAKTTILKHYRELFGDCINMVAARIPCSVTHNLTFCVYKGYVFFGIQKKKEKYIAFSDRANVLSVLTPTAVNTLTSRTTNALTQEKKKLPNLCSKETSAMWEDTIPLLDKIIVFEEKIKSLPEDVLHKFRERLLYDECIDVIISTGTGFSPDLEEEIEKRISQAFKIAGKSEIEEPSMSLR